jgi:hypothetical protein
MSNLPPSSPVPSPEGPLARYKNLIVRIIGVTERDRSRIQWITEDGELRVSAVKRENLRPMQPQLF